MFAEELIHKTTDIRSALAARKYAEAIRLADEFEWKHGHHLGISDLRTEAERAIDAEEALKEQREKALRQITDCLNEDDFASAEILLQKRVKAGILRNEDPVVMEAIEKARELKLRSEEQRMRTAQRRREQVSKGYKLLANHSFDECLEAAAGLQREFPEDKEVLELIRATEAAKLKQQWLDGIKHQVERGDLAAARKQLTMLKQGYAHDDEITRCQELVIHAEENQRKKAHLEEKLASLQKSFEAGKYEEVIRTGEIVLRTYPTEARVGELVRKANARIAAAKEEKQKLGRAQAAQADAASSFGTASAIGLPERAVEPATKGTSPAEKPVETRSKPPLKQAAPVVAGPAAQDDLATVQKCLANFIGPLAILLVKKARIATADPEQQLNMLIAGLKSETDKQSFLTHREEMLECLGRLPSIAGQALAGTTIFAKAAEVSKLDAEAIARASNELAKYLGPISRVLTERAARQADSLRTLYLMLSEHLANKDERARFLQESGVND
jgi:hypothetical protein